jgi:hypothetical protein
MWKSTQIGRIVLMIVLMLVLVGSPLGAAGVAQAEEQSGTCLIVGVAAFSNRVDVRCGNGSEFPKVICAPGGAGNCVAPTVFAVPITNDALASKVVILGAASIQTSKNTKIWFNTDADERYGCSAKDCRPLTGIEILP